MADLIPDGNYRWAIRRASGEFLGSVYQDDNGCYQIWLNAIRDKQFPNDWRMVEEYVGDL